MSEQASDLLDGSPPSEPREMSITQRGDLAQIVATTRGTPVEGGRPDQQ
ncbi:MAG: hypothetical protein L0K86_06345 [Actinomycetia bacterium]|nr:hypothetical protein [Actinomycetes bacterium]